MNVRELYNKYENIESKEIEYLLRYKYNVDMYAIIFNEDIHIDWNEFDSDIIRLGKKEPGQYIVGSQDFMGLPFYVGKGVLIPRPETEILVNILSNENLKGKSVLDICAGTGAIGISVAKLYKADVTCSDISNEAIEYIEKNVELNDVDINIIRSDLFTNIKETFDIIVSNPPYIPTDEIANLEDNVKKYEPILALDGGKDGLHFYKSIVEKAPEFLKNGGKLYFEIGHDQGEDVKKLLMSKFEDIRIIKDYNDFDRIVIATLRRKDV